MTVVCEDTARGYIVWINAMRWVTDSPETKGWLIMRAQQLDQHQREPSTNGQRHT